MCDDYCRSRPAGCVQMEAGIAEEHHVLNTVKTVPASISVHQLVLGTEGVFCGSCSLISDQTVLCGNDPSGARPLKCLFFTQLFNKVLEVSQYPFHFKYSVHVLVTKKKKRLGHSSHPASLRQTLSLDVINVHLKLRFHQEISRLPG